ncbi:hypothetical protein MUB05_06480 [Acinetobacter indicus]|uniref:hypothetical protein n=1 Tax=Acinetobacter TaxID=469 RepID=UPI00209CE65B|nr:MULTISPECIES: hypothetical protein [Acinetobacter]MCP0916230.1 hypothetical protein [Acinetobacter indicus]MCP0919356.1 hypothetical protein [Acinetobacter indicus]MCP0922022.1 hypothetical protein [Acinetobacter indicus]
MINRFLPSLEKFEETEKQYIEYFTAKGEKDVIGKVISNMKSTAEIQASQGVDAWLWCLFTCNRANFCHA